MVMEGGMITSLESIGFTMSSTVTILLVAIMGLRCYVLPKIVVWEFKSFRVKGFVWMIHGECFR